MAVHWLFNGFHLDNTRTCKVENDFHYYQAMMGFTKKNGSIDFEDPHGKSTLCLSKPIPIPFSV